MSVKGPRLNHTPVSRVSQVVEAAKTYVKPDGTPNVLKIHQVTGLARSTIDNLLKRVRDGEYPGFSLDNTTPADTPEMTIAALQDELRRTRKELADTKRDIVEMDAIHVLIGRIADAPKNPPKWTLNKPAISKNMPEVPVTVWSDWHYGEVVKAEEVGGVNEYDSEIAEHRIQRLIENTIDVCRNHGPENQPGIVVNLLGDFISGGLHPELLRTDEYGRIPASIRVHDLLVTALRTMADEFGNVYVPAASGNHGRNTTRPEYKGYVYHNFDWLIYEMLRRTLADDKRIIIDNPVANQVHYKVFNTSFLAMHGDMLGARGGDGIIGAIGPIMRGEFKTRRQAGAIGQGYQYLVIGHYHQRMWLRNAIVAGSIKGFDEYVKNDLRAEPEPPTQPLFFVSQKRGITSKWDIHVEDNDAEIAPAEWVSVFKNGS